MEPETLEALKASIAKWEGNAVAETPEEYTVGVLSCPLCTLFFDNNCTGCPVKAATGRTGCEGTPYEAAHDRWVFWAVLRTRGTRDAAHAAARDEAQFLRSLLPEVQP